MINTRQYIVIDDDGINNVISRYMIRQALGEQTDVITFTSGREAVDFIRKSYSESSRFKQILLLDINMPDLNGWQTLDIIERLDSKVKKRLLICMLSSSIDPADRKRAIDHPLVSDFIEKPLTSERVLSISVELEKSKD